MSIERRVVIATGIAALGAVFGVAGTGHAYLRQWRRALGWFLFVLATGVALVFTFADPANVTPETLPQEVTFPLVGLLALNTVDAYYVARREVTQQTADAVASASMTGSDTGADTDTDTDTDEAATCPHCGKPADPDLDFCHWCTEPLEDPGHQNGG